MHPQIVWTKAQLNSFAKFIAREQANCRDSVCTALSCISGVGVKRKVSTYHSSI